MKRLVARVAASVAGMKRAQIQRAHGVAKCARWPSGSITCNKEKQQALRRMAGLVTEALAINALNSVSMTAIGFCRAGSYAL